MKGSKNCGTDGLCPLGLRGAQEISDGEIQLILLDIVHTHDEGKYSCTL